MKLYMVDPEYQRGKTKVKFGGHESYSGMFRSNSYRYADVVLYKDGAPIITVRQATTWALFLLAPIRFVDWYDAPPYDVCYKGQKIGKSVFKTDRHSYEFFIKGNTYMLRRHSHDIGSLTKNGRQIARYAWDRKGPVEIECIKDCDFELILAFAIFFCARYYARGPFYVFLLCDEYKHLANWHVKDDDQV